MSNVDIFHRKEEKSFTEHDMGPFRPGHCCTPPQITRGMAAPGNSDGLAVSVRLVPVGADADLGQQRNGKRRHRGHAPRQLDRSSGPVRDSGTSSTSSSWTCMISRDASFSELDPAPDVDHRELDQVGRGALHRRVDGGALGCLRGAARWAS